jgi:hypothetical protein
LEAEIQVDRDHQRQGGKGDQVEIREPVLLLEPPKDEVQSHYASSTVRGATLPYVRQALSPGKNTDRSGLITNPGEE